MKRSNWIHFLVGMFAGALIFGGSIAYAAGVLATPTASKVYVDGASVSVDAYQINGSNYFKLRDFTAAVDIGVWYDGTSDIIYIETDKGYDAAYTGPQASTPPAAASGNDTGSSNTPSDVTARQVYYTRTGSKYHYNSNCGNGTYYPCTLSEAYAKGLSACSKCVY